jgi:hypothetical protein
LAGLLLSAAPCLAQGSPSGRSAFPLACTYASTSGELDVEEACASLAGETPVLAPLILAKLSYEKGLAYFTVQGMAYHRRHDGTTRRMYIFDNGADHFVEGLARAIVGGKIVYVDRRLRIRIATSYDWGDRFDQGRADVCIGCRSVPVGDGEHSVMEGGRWGMIDKSGREVMPVTLIQAEFVAQRDRLR